MRDKQGFAKRSFVFSCIPDANRECLMSLRFATFNVENLLTRFDFTPRGRRWSVTRIPGGTGRRHPTIAPSS